MCRFLDGTISPPEFLRTGDAGFLLNTRELYVLGRLSEVIALPGGRRLYPQDIEAVVEQVDGIQCSVATSLDKDAQTRRPVIIVVAEVCAQMLEKGESEGAEQITA